MNLPDIQLKLWNVLTFRWAYVIIVISYMNVVGKIYVSMVVFISDS